MIAIDTDILVYAHREDSSWHEAADRYLASAAESATPWAIPWPCIHEFLAIVTHPRIYDPPTPQSDALEQVAPGWRCRPWCCWPRRPGIGGAPRDVGTEPRVRTAGPRCPDRSTLSAARGEGAVDGGSRLRALCRPQVQKSAGRGRLKVCSGQIPGVPAMTSTPAGVGQSGCGALVAEDPGEPMSNAVEVRIQNFRPGRG